MPLTAQPTIWTITPAGTWTTDIRASLDAALDTSLDYVDTTPGAWTSIAGDALWRADQGMAAALASMLLDTAPRQGVVARAYDAGITPRAATSSVYSVVVVGDGTLPEGSQVRGGGDDGMAVWEVIEGFGTVANGDAVVISALVPGPTTITNPTTLTFLTPLPGLTALTYSGGDEQIGRPEQSTTELRIAVRRAHNRAGGSVTGLRSAVIALPWVVAASVEGAEGIVLVTVAPAPVGDTQEQELGNAIYQWLPAGASTQGTGISVVGADGRDVTVRYEAGVTQAVNVVLTLTTDGTVTDAATEEAAEATIAAIFAALSQGETLYYYRALAAFATISGVTAAVLTLNGSTGNITPTSSADILVSGAVTVTIA